jgi:hypothetical protein
MASFYYKTCSLSALKKWPLVCPSSDKKRDKLVFSSKLIIIYETLRHIYKQQIFPFVNEK